MIKKIISLSFTLIFFIGNPGISCLSCVSLVKEDALRPAAVKNESGQVSGIAEQIKSGPKASSSGLTISSLIQSAKSSIKVREHRLLQMSNPDKNLKQKIEVLDILIRFTPGQERELGQLINRYFELERLVHRIKSTHISRGRLNLLSIAGGTIFSKELLRKALQPAIYSDRAVPGEDGIDLLSMFGEGGGSSDEFFDPDLVSMTLEGFEYLSSAIGTGFESTAVAIVYSKKLEADMPAIAINLPDQVYLGGLLSAFILSREERDALICPEILTLEGIKALRRETIIRRGVETVSLDVVHAQDPFSPREVGIADGILDRYIENVVVDDSIFPQAKEILSSLGDRVIAASVYFKDNPRIIELQDSKRRIVDIINMAEKVQKSASAGRQEIDGVDAGVNVEGRIKSLVMIARTDSAPLKRQAAILELTDLIHKGRLNRLEYMQAIDGLAAIGHEAEEALPVLLTHLGEPLDMEGFDRLSDDRKKDRIRLVRAIGKIDKGSGEVIELLIHFLGDSSGRAGLRQNSADYAAKAALIEIGQPVIPFARDALKLPNPYIKRNAIEILGELRAEAAVDELTDIVEIEEPEKRVVDIAEIDRIKWFFRDDEFRLAAIESLGKIGHPGRKALPTLFRVVSPDRYISEEPAVRVDPHTGTDSVGEMQELREAAVIALAHIDPSSDEVIDMLIDVLGEEEPGNENHPGRYLHKTHVNFTNVGESSSRCLIEMGSLTVPALIHVLTVEVDGHENYNLTRRKRIVEILGKIDPQYTKEAVPLLGDIAENDFYCGTEAIWALYRMQGFAVGALTNLLNLARNTSLSVSTRCRAIMAIGNMGEWAFPAVDDLILFLSDASEDNHHMPESVSGSAESALIKIGKPAVIKLAEALKRSNYPVSYKIIDALEFIGKNAISAIPILEEICSPESEHFDKHKISQLLEKLRYFESAAYKVKQDEDLAYYIGRLGDRNDNDDWAPMRRDAAKELGKFNDSRAFRLLVNIFQECIGPDAVDKQWKLAAVIAESLGYIGNKDAIEILELEKRHKSDEIRKSVQEALIRIRSHNSYLESQALRQRPQNITNLIDSSA